MKGFNFIVLALDIIDLLELLMFVIFCDYFLGLFGFVEIKSKEEFIKYLLSIV